MTPETEPLTFMEKLASGNDRLAEELKIERDPVIAYYRREQLSQIKFIGASILGLVIMVGLGNKYVDDNRDKITAMRESMYAESGFIPETELTPCQKITRKGIMAKAGKLVAYTTGLCEAELAGINANPKTPTTIVSFNTEGQR